MAPSAANGDTATGLEEVSKPPEGIVLPPKDIRAIVEKTAGYVARNGAVFEERIREKEKHNPKFSFLSANDAYNAFYAWRLAEVREGRGTAVSAGRPGEAQLPTEAEMPKGPSPPQEFRFSARMPNISAQDLEVVKLTALFVAKNGRSFMTTLSQKESRNFQFDFLRPQHSLYQFFSRLVDQYTDLLQAQSVDGGRIHKIRLQEVEANVTNRFHVLKRAKQRAEWVKFQQQQKQEKQEEEERERIEYAQIDWHDFVVVETVLFTEADDQAELPPPTSLTDLQSASLEQKAAMSLQPHNMRIEEAMPTDEDIYYGSDPYQQVQQPLYGTNLPSIGASYNGASYGLPAPQVSEYGRPSLVGFAQDEDESRAIAERTEARERTQAAQAAAKGGHGQPMRIRNDYVPRAQAKRQNVAMGICPNCNQQFPVDEMSEHMRIELLDPSWKEQRQKADSRYSNYGTADFSSNLKRLASQRTDEPGVGQPTIVTEEEARRKRAALGGNDGVGARGMDINEQIRQIHEKYNQ